MTKFEVGKTYGTKHFFDTITISKRTEKTIWFCDNHFQCRVKKTNDYEYIEPNIGIIRKSYRSNIIK